MLGPKWVDLGRQLIGLHEIKGPQNNPEIVQMFKDIRRSGIKDDETPWCAAFVGAMLERAGVTSSRFESAKSYLDWGVKLDTAVYGCIVVFTREGGGHVGFVVGRDAKDNLLVLGGNQGDQVCIRTFPLDRVSGYRWPENVMRSTQPLGISSADATTSEA